MPSLNLNWWLAQSHFIDCFIRFSVSCKIYKGAHRHHQNLQQVEGCIQDMQQMRQTTDEEFHKIFKQTERLAEKLHVEPTIPRFTVRQIHRNNVSAENPEEYYRRALAIPFIDRFIAEMTFKFNSFNKTSSKLLLLVSSIICDRSTTT